MVKITNYKSDNKVVVMFDNFTQIYSNAYVFFENGEVTVMSSKESGKPQSRLLVTSLVNTIIQFK